MIELSQKWVICDGSVSPLPVRKTKMNKRKCDTNQEMEKKNESKHLNQVYRKFHRHRHKASI